MHINTIISGQVEAECQKCLPRYVLNHFMYHFSAMNVLMLTENALWNSEQIFTIIILY